MDYGTDQLTDCQAQILSYWELIRLEIENMKCDHCAFKTQDLPLARIKKIMKLDDDLKSMMISAEAPILFAKAAELFIRELTLRAWIHTERNRRRTLQRNDIAMAVSDGDTDQFDFLIDIVPREEVRVHRRPQQTSPTSNVVLNMPPSNMMVKSENAASPVSYGAGTTTVMTNGGGRLSSTNTTTDTIQQNPQTVTIALGGGADGMSSIGGAAGLSAVLQQHHQQQLQSANQSTPGAIQFLANIPSTTAANTGTPITVSTQSGNAATTLAAMAGGGAGGQIQYVLQLPAGAGGANSGQPIQIQLLPQHFQGPTTLLLQQSTGSMLGATAVLTNSTDDVNGQSTTPTITYASLPMLDESGVSVTTNLSVADCTQSVHEIEEQHQQHVAMNSHPTQMLLSFTNDAITCVEEDTAQNIATRLMEQGAQLEEPAPLEQTNSTTHHDSIESELVGATQEEQGNNHPDPTGDEDELSAPQMSSDDFLQPCVDSAFSVSEEMQPEATEAEPLAESMETTEEACIILKCAADSP